MVLCTQLQEEDGLCPAPLRPDLLSVLEEAKAWCLRVLKAGETNVKGYLLMSMISARVEGLMRGLGEKEVTSLLVKAVENVGEKCLPILEEMAASIQEQDETQQSTAVEMINDWNFLVSVNHTYICSQYSSAADQAWQIPDVSLNPGDTKPMSWIFNKESDQGFLEL